MKYYFLFFGILFLLNACSFSIDKFSVPLKRIQPSKKVKEITRITFGSCAGQYHRQPILKRVAESDPDLFIYLGDNIYGDTENMKTLARKYKKLARKPSFKNLVKNVRVLATWDDHDYGENDAGKYYPKKEESKKIFLAFFNEPKNSERRKHPGIYHAEMYEYGDRTLQVILLDTRTFRSDLYWSDGKNGHKHDYMPNPFPDSTFLGNEQWIWLEEQFKRKADVRIIASSNQFAHEYNGFESWTNVPREQEKMLQLIQTTKANGVIFISGDVHWGEISKREIKNGYPIYDITSSGITRTWKSPPEPNKYRLGKTERNINFGCIEIDWNKKDPEIHFSIRNIKGISTVTHSITLSELNFN